jgi:hypothetical protein
MFWHASHTFYHLQCRGSVVIHDVPLALVGFIGVLTQPTHGGAATIEIAIFGIYFHTATFSGIIQPFTAETYATLHVVALCCSRQ